MDKSEDKDTDNYKVLFVCLGNICRSPLAEGVFYDLVCKNDLVEKIEVDSCGTGSWHVGNLPHEGSVKVAKKNGIDITYQRSRQLEVSDLSDFDLIVAMDSSNKENILSLGSVNPSKVVLMRDYEPNAESPDVPDPYYGGGFDKVYDIINVSCANLFEEVKGKL